MTTTVKLTSTYGNFGPGTILDLPDDVASALLAGGIGATTDLTGGVRKSQNVPVVGTAQLSARSAPLQLGTGQESTIPLPRGYVLVVSGSTIVNARVKTTLADRTVHPAIELAHGGRLLIGPFSQDAAVLVRVVDGTVATSSVTLAEARSLRVRNGAVLMGDSIMDQNYLGLATATAIVDNGDGTATATGAGLKGYVGDIVSFKQHPVPALNQLRARVLSATISATNVTSLTYALDGAYTPNTQSGTPTIYSERMESDRGFVVQMRADSRQAFKILASFAVGGSTTEDGWAVIEAALAQGGSVLVCQYGTNNVYAKGFTPAVSIASFKRIIDRVVEVGMVPLFHLILPHGESASPGNNTDATAAMLAPVNRWLKAYLPSVGGICVDDWSQTVNGKTFADFTSANSKLGLANTEMLYDLVHPSRLGAYAKMKAARAARATLFPLAPSNLANPMDIAANTKVFFENKLLTGTNGPKTPGGGTINGNAPTGINVIIRAGAPVVNLSIIPRTEAEDGDAVGNKLRVVIDNAPVGSSVRIFWSGLSTNWAHGDVLATSARVKTSNGATPGSGAPVGWSLPALTLNMNTSLTGTDIATALLTQGATTPPVNEAVDWSLATVPFPFKWQGAAMHGAFGLIRSDLDIIAGTAAASITLDFALPDTSAMVPS